MIRDDLCEELAQFGIEIPIFHKSFWLDAVCGPNNWERLIHRNKDQKILGVFSFATRKRFGMKFISQPMLTPALGPLLFIPPNLSERQKTAFEIEVVEALLR